MPDIVFEKVAILTVFVTAIAKITLMVMNSVFESIHNLMYGREE